MGKPFDVFYNLISAIQGQKDAEVLKLIAENPELNYDEVNDAKQSIIEIAAFPPPQVRFNRQILMILLQAKQTDDVTPLVNLNKPYKGATLRSAIESSVHCDDEIKQLIASLNYPKYIPANHEDDDNSSQLTSSEDEDSMSSDEIVQTANQTDIDMASLKRSIARGDLNEMQKILRKENITSKVLQSWPNGRNPSSENEHGQHRIHHVFREVTLRGKFAPILILLSENVCDDELLNNLVKYIVIETIAEGQSDTLMAIFSHAKITSAHICAWLPEMLREAVNKEQKNVIINIVNHTKCDPNTIPSSLMTSHGKQEIQLVRNKDQQLNLTFKKEDHNVDAANQVRQPNQILELLIRAMRENTHDIDNLPQTTPNCLRYPNAIQLLSENERLIQLLAFLDSNKNIPSYRVFQVTNAKQQTVAALLDQNHTSLLATHPRLMIVAKLVLYKLASNKWHKYLHHADFVDQLLKANVTLAEMHERVEVYAKTNAIKSNGDFDIIRQALKRAVTQAAQATAPQQEAATSSNGAHSFR